MTDLMSEKLGNLLYIHPASCLTWVGNHNTHSPPKKCVDTLHLLAVNIPGAVGRLLYLLSSSCIKAATCSSSAQDTVRFLFRVGGGLCERQRVGYYSPPKTAVYNV